MATVHPVDNFDARQDAEELNKAMKGLGTDEAAITFLLGARSNAQRQEIKVQFKQMFGKDLIENLKSELSGKYEDVIIGLMMTPADYDAYVLRDAISGVGTNEKALIEILCTRDNAQIKALRDSYKRLYKKDLEKDIQSDTSGRFKRLMTSLVQGARDENDGVDESGAIEDANALKTAGEDKWGTDESRFNAILASRSFKQLEQIFHQYEVISGKQMEDVIKSEFSGDIEDGMLAIVKCAKSRTAFFAETLYKSMKGLGTDDKTLIRVMVTRCEVDMEHIKNDFRRMYNQTLNEFIEGDCSGDYKKVLLKLAGHN